MLELFFSDKIKYFTFVGIFIIFILIAGVAFAAYNYTNIENKAYLEYKNANFYSRIGGLVGQVEQGVVKNSYSVADIKYSEDVSGSSHKIENYFGGAIGASLGTVTDVFYEDTCAYDGVGTAATQGDMRSPDLDVEFFLGNYFSVDNNNMNNLYPILKWQTK